MIGCDSAGVNLLLASEEKSQVEIKAGIFGPPFSLLVPDLVPVASFTQTYRTRVCPSPCARTCLARNQTKRAAPVNFVLPEPIAPARPGQPLKEELGRGRSRMLGQEPLSAGRWLAPGAGGRRPPGEHWWVGACDSSQLSDTNRSHLQGFVGIAGCELQGRWRLWDTQIAPFLPHFCRSHLKLLF